MKALTIMMVGLILMTIALPILGLLYALGFNPFPGDFHQAIISLLVLNQCFLLMVIGKIIEKLKLGNKENNNRESKKSTRRYGGFLLGRATVIGLANACLTSSQTYCHFHQQLGQGVHF